MKKRFASLIMALVMALSLAIPAFAASGNSETSLGQSTKITSTTNEATIKVTVPATLTAALNPYSIGYKINDTWLAAETYNQEQVASPDNLIISQSNIPLDVYVNVVGTPSSGVTLETTPVGTKKTKSVYMYAVFGTVDTGLVTATDLETAVKPPYTHVAPPVYPATPSTTADATSGITNQIIIKSTALTKAVKVGTLAEVPYGGDTPAPQTISAIAYKLGGDMVVAPENNGAANNWVKTDKVDLEFTFTFVPGTANVAADYTGAKAEILTTSTGADTVVNLYTLLTTAANVSGDAAFTTAAHADNHDTAKTDYVFALSNIKINNLDAKKGDTALVTLDSTDKETVKINGKTAFFDSGNPFSGRVGEIHYLTFDVTYKDVNNWVITKTLKFPLEIKTGS